MAQSTKQPHFHLIKSSEMETGEKTVRDPPSAAAGGGSGAGAAAAAKSLDCTFIHPTRLALDCNRPSSQLAANCQMLPTPKALFPLTQGADSLQARAM